MPQAVQMQKKSMNVSKTVRRKHPAALWFLAGFLITAAFMFAGYCVIGVWPFGDGTVLIIDSLHQYLPFYTDLHEKLVHHSSLFYSFSAGLGYNFWATYAYYFASPLNFLIALVPTANVCDFMDYMILFKVALAGGTFTWYLYKRNRRATFLCPAFGTMFALSFFMIGYYFNIMWFDSVAMLPLIMKGIERICGIGDEGMMSRRSDGRLYCISLFYALWCNYYIGFMLCIFSVLYLIVCLVIAGKIRLRLFFGRIFRFLWYSVLAGGMAGVVLLPAYRALSASEAVKSNSFPDKIRFYTDFVNMVLTQFAGIKPINIANTQVGLNAYCGVSVLMLTILFLLDDKIRLRERIARAALAAFLMLSFSLNILNYVWHGFHQQNGLPNRFSFLFIAMILIMSFDVLRDVRELSLAKVIFAGIIPIAFCLLSWISGYGTDHEENAYPDSSYEITLALLCGYFALILIIRIRRMKRAMYSFLVAVMCICEAGVSAVWGIVCNDSVTRSIYLNDQKSYKTLVPQMNDDGWFRSEVDSQRMRDVTLFCGGNAVVMFNSTMQESVTYFCDRIGMESRTNKNGYNGVTKLMNDVLGIKYVLSSQGKADTLYQFKEQADDGNLTIYKNEDALSLGFMVSPLIRDWNVAAGTPIDVQNDFVVKAAGSEPIYTLDRDLTMESGQENGIRIPEGKQVYVYLPQRVSELQLTTPEYFKTYSTFTDHLYVINEAGGNDMASMTATVDGGGSAQAMIYTCPDAAEKAVVDKLREHQLENVIASGNRLSGDVSAAEDGILLLTIPYDQSWTCYVDGEKTEPEMIGSCLLGIPVSAGDHKIRMVYVPVGFKEGLLATFACVVLLILSLVLRSRSHKGENMGNMAEMADAQAYLEELLGQDALVRHAKMSGYTTMRVGGEAFCMVFPDTPEHFAQTVSYLRKNRIPCYVMGNGSNLLVSDKGYEGFIVRTAKAMNHVEVSGDVIEAQAGALLSTIARTALEHSLTGLECEAQIPGTLGGALAMNAGAYGGEMKDIVLSVRVLTREGKIRELSNEQCAFGYRTSAIQRKGMVVLDAKLKLNSGDPEEISAKMAELRARRIEKQPLDLPSAGSTFKRPEGHYAGALIDEAGMRGYRVGGAMVSEKHAGFVVNAGKATSDDVMQVIEDVRKAVYKKSGVMLEPEVRMLGFDQED